LSTFINLIGLTLGFACAIFLFQIVRFEKSFDDFYVNKSLIYRVQSKMKEKLGASVGVHTPQGLVNKIRTEIVGVEQVALIDQFSKDISVGQETLKSQYTFFAQAEVFKIIDVQWISGNPEQALSKAWKVVLDEKTALKLFGSTDILGKTLKVEDKYDFTVSGVIKNAPANSSFPFEVLLSYESEKKMTVGYEYEEDYWGGGPSMHQAYLLLDSKADKAKIEAQLSQFAQQNEKRSNYASFALQPLAQIHFDTENLNFNYTISEWLVNALIFIGLLLILIAGFNFVNLALAQNTKRSKEIGVRKVLGSSRIHLTAQFFMEASLLVITSAILGTWAALECLPFANQLFNTKISGFDYWNTDILVTALLLSLSTVCLSAFYPSWVLSSFQAINILKNNTITLGRQSLSVRKVLVISQFVISQILVVCAILVLQQMSFIRKKELGFEKEGIVKVRMPLQNDQLAENLRSKLLQTTDIKDVTYSLTAVMGRGNWCTVFHPSLPNGETSFMYQFTDLNYFDFYKISLLAGRKFVPSDTLPVVIMNEQGIKALGYKSAEMALGEKVLIFGDEKASIIGVVKDYHALNLKASIQPMVFFYGTNWFRQVNIKVNTSEVVEAVSTIERAWKEVFPNYYFEYSFLEADIAKFYEEESKFAKLITLFSSIAILIACLGLYGIISFVALQRVKEVGIRKVLGANVLQITTLLSKDFLKLVMLAFVIASPIAYYFMDKWLADFAYRITISWWVFALSGAAAVLIALLTVSWQSIRAALANPVKSLRSE
jgi:ABC-type antimicrobial peptide transport system permease subunit